MRLAARDVSRIERAASSESVPVAWDDDEDGEGEEDGSTGEEKKSSTTEGRSFCCCCGFASASPKLKSEAKVPVSEPLGDSCRSCLTASEVGAKVATDASCFWFCCGCS